jgi:hypothetical protein
MKAQTTDYSAFRASPPSRIVQDKLGPLAELPGTWVGKGFNLISLPDKQEGKTFRLKLNAIHETLTFTSTGVIPNRGFVQPDISFFGLYYLQQINDAETNEGLHIEPGLWLNLPAVSTDPVIPPWKWTVARLGTIPHGDALFAQGPYKTIPNDFDLPESGEPFIDSIDPTPFTLDARGARQKLTDDKYLTPFKTATPPPGIPGDAILNPNIILSDAIKGQNIVKTIVLSISAAPVGNIDLGDVDPHLKKPPFPRNPNNNGDILNIPFVVANANANSFAAIFWIETVKNPDGSEFLQLQYTQTVILEFSGVHWPHISVSTLVKR